MLTPTKVAKFFTAVHEWLRGWSKTLATLTGHLNVTVDSAPGRNGRLFGYRATAAKDEH